MLVYQKSNQLNNQSWGKVGEVDLSINLAPETVNRVSPNLIALNEVLVLSSQELQEAISAELDSNPALEMDERQLCPTCGRSYKGRVCQYCLDDNLGSKVATQPTNEHKSTLDDYQIDWDSGYYAGSEGWSSGLSGGDEDFDPLAIVAAEMSMTERILADLTAVLEPDDVPIAEFLVGSLDERGYLSVAIESVAQTFSVDEEQVVRVLKELQLVAPPGVGARDFRECLLIQLRYLKEQGISAPHVQEIVEDYFTALGEHKYSFIAQQMSISIDDINKARDFIKKNLNPFPAEGQTGELNGVRYGSRAGQVVPDVMITERDGEYHVEVVESKRFFLKLSPLYMSLATKLSAMDGSTTEQEQAHIRQYVARAKTFMSNINQRRETMYKITTALVEIQQEFLQNGVRDLKPLTRSMLASYLGLHESTVSRATAGKYVMLPNRKVIPYSDFFTASLSIKDVIKEIIEHEERKGTSKLTDQAIVDKLGERGIQIARRTIAKYRSQLKILPSNLR